MPGELLTRTITMPVQLYHHPQREVHSQDLGDAQQIPTEARLWLLEVPQAIPDTMFCCLPTECYSGPKSILDAAH